LEETVTASDRIIVRLMSAQPAAPLRSRRWFLGAGSSFAAVLAATRAAMAQQPLGRPLTPYGQRSRFELEVRATPTRATQREIGATFTPLASSFGILTPSSLHFERHHAGVPDIDPAAHTLTVHGLVERPLVFTVAELKRLPAESRVLFIECAGNTSSEWTGAGAPDVQRTHGLMSCSEWTGVRLSTVLRECGIGAAASWVLAEGADACRMARSIPIAKALDDTLVAYGQNGEALRPEQGYPLRLVVPGWEGNISVKWLHRLEVIDAPAMTRWETARYTDVMPDGTARQFTFEMDAKSVITRPSGGQRLTGAGPYEISGIAWSGRGAIRRVDVTTDGGATWAAADIQQPALPLAFTRFRRAWRWDGRAALLASRCEDDTGYVQPARPDLIRARGLNSAYHQNAIQVWRVAPDGAVTNGNS
jgi:sulfane dehydrogenase subunit SoxC